MSVLHFIIFIVLCIITYYVLECIIIIVSSDLLELSSVRGAEVVQTRRYGLVIFVLYCNAMYLYYRIILL